MCPNMLVSSRKKGGELIMARLLAYLVDLPLSSCFLLAPNPQALLKSIDIDVGCPTSHWRGKAGWK